MTDRTACIVPGLALAMFALAAPLSAQETSNYELRAVPAPGSVTIDGKLDEWDTSGEILMCHDVGRLLETRSARVAAMYGPEGLYISLRVKDDTPMQSRWDPVAQPFQGWRADNAQIYFWDDPDTPFGPEGSRVSQLTAWWCHTLKRPGASMLVGPIGHGREPEARLTDLVGKGVDLAYAKDPDGQGYTAELRVDWKLLSRSGRIYGAGESMGMGMEIFWGDAAGDGPEHRLTDLLNAAQPQRSFYWSTPDAWGKVAFTADNHVAPSPSIALLNAAERLRRALYTTEGPVPITYDIPADGGVTLVIEDTDGNRLRNLISDYPRRAGTQTDFWDGRDDEGRLVAPGAYRVRGLFHEDLDVLYEFAFGSPSHPPWPTADGRGGWLSNHCNHLGVLADAERIYVSVPETEGPYVVVALDYDGNKVWGGLSRWFAGYMARCGDYLYTVNDRHARPAGTAEDLDKDAEIQLIRLDPATGREVVFPDGQSKHVVATWNIQKQGTAKQWEGWTISHKAHDADWLGINPQGLAAMGDTLFLSLHYNDKLLAIDAETGTASREIPLADPSGLASDGERLLAVSGTQVVEVDTASGTATPVITNGLSAPVGLAVDAEGQIYVSDWADQMCVKVFGPDGAYVRSIGKPGGRAWVGAYDPAGMLLPSALSIDARGRLWIAEHDFSPRRVSCWDTATGGLILERLGKGRYGNMGYYVLPDDPTRGILNNNLLELDWNTGQWRVLSTLWRPTHPDEEIGFDPYTRFGRVLHYQGRRLLIHSSRRPQYGPTVISELKAGRARPLAAIGSCGRALLTISARHKAGYAPHPVIADHLWTDARMQQAARDIVPWFFHGPMAGDYRAVSYPRERVKIWRQSRIGGLPKTHGAPNANFLWCDLNGNGRMEADEMQYYATPGLDGPLPSSWDAECWSGGVVDDELTIYLTAIQDQRTHHFRLPVVRWTAAGTPVYDPARAGRLKVSTTMGEAAWLSREGNLLTLGNTAGVGRTDRRRDPLVMFRPDGSVAWTFPSPWTGVHGSHTAPKEKRGRLVGPLGVCGEAMLEGVGEIFAFHTNVGTLDFFTADGLFLGRVFRDGRSAPEPWPEQPRRGQSIKDVTNGGEWFGGQFFRHPETGRFYVVCCRHAGVIARVTGLDSVRRLPPQPIELTAARYAEAAAMPPAEAADTAERVMRVAPLRPAPAARPFPVDAFPFDAARSATWRYDDARSAQATWTHDDTHLHVAFKVEDDTPMINGGEDVRRLFKFGDAAILELRTDANQTAKEAAPGDLRLLFSVHNGKPVAVLYDYRRPCEGVEPTEFTSVKTTRIDCLKVLEDADIEIERTGSGYTLVAAVPLKALRWSPEPGTAYPGDFGIVYSDRKGESNALRLYWANKATGIVSDLSQEADIQPANWGRFEVE